MRQVIVYPFHGSTIGVTVHQYDKAGVQHHDVIDFPEGSVLLEADVIVVLERRRRELNRVAVCRLNVGRASRGQYACQLASEHAARAQVDVEVTGVVRHAQLLGHRPYTAIDEEPRPDGVGLPLSDRHVRVALGKAEIEDVADGDG